MRVKVSVSINQEIYEKAHSLGLNVSKVSENAIKACIDALENINNPKQPVSVDAFPQKRVMAGPLGFEPKISGSEERFSWIDFRAYLDKEYSKRNVAEIFNYNQRYAEYLWRRDFTPLQRLSDGLRPHVLKALSAMAKFVGCYDDFKWLVGDSGLRWKGKSADDLMIDRLTRVQDPDELFRWLRDLKTRIVDLGLFADFIAVTGLRLVEAVHSYNLIIQLNASGTLTLDRVGQNYRCGYFNRELSTLEHFWFRDVFLRPTKKAFISFVPETLVSAIAEMKPLKNSGQIQKLVASVGLHGCFGDVRENHASFMTRFLKPPEIDFLHGRVSTSVFMSNYFNPALVGDLKARAFQGITEIMEKVKT